MMDEAEQHIRKKFHLSDKLGKGAYGIVWKATDNKTKQVLALKKCFDAFRNSTDARRTYREIMYLQKLSGHPNIIKLRHIIKSNNPKDIYLTFDIMDTDLCTVSRAHILEEVHIQYILYQLFSALKYIHSAGLIHRDIKPSNILINSNCDIKICDFGLCRSIHDNSTPNVVLTDYVATRWYRAPEILVGSILYNQSVDIWSTGCILGELHTGRPTFPGSSTMNQIEKILACVGPVDSVDIQSLNSPYALVMIESITLNKTKSLAEVYSNTNSVFIDLLLNLLQFNQSKRITAEQALEHEYLQQFHNADNEPSYPNPPVSLLLNDSSRLNALDYQRQIYKESKMNKYPVR